MLIGASIISLRGLPRGLSILAATVLGEIPGSTSEAGHALAKSSVVHSGLSVSNILSKEALPFKYA